MSAGSDHEPTIDPEEVVEQMRSASERLRDQARIIAAVTAQHSPEEPLADPTP